MSKKLSNEIVEAWAFGNDYSGGWVLDGVRKLEQALEDAQAEAADHLAQILRWQKDYTRDIEALRAERDAARLEALYEALSLFEDHDSSQAQRVLILIADVEGESK